MKVLLLLLLPVLLSACGKPSTMVQADAQMLHTALKEYAMMNNEYPSGDTAAITRAIKGGNPHHVVLAEFPAGHTSPDGRLLDPWGTPYRIDYPVTGSARITSAGPDRRFDTADDIISINPSVLPSPSP